MDSNPDFSRPGPLYSVLTGSDRDQTTTTQINARHFRVLSNNYKALLKLLQAQLLYANIVYFAGFLIYILKESKMSTF